MNFKLWLEQTNKKNTYWGGMDLITQEGSNLKIHLSTGKILTLPEKNNISRLQYAPKNETFQPPWVKYFEYNDNDVITYAENRVVDIVLISPKYNAIYLIDRKTKPVGLALPGGFIDEDEIKKHVNPSENIEKKAAIDAAAREVNEETKLDADKSKLIFVGKFPMQGSDKREAIVSTFVFKYPIIDDTQMKSLRAGDDAGQAQGSKDMVSKGFLGWYNLEDVNSINFAFPEHKEIIMRAL